MSVKTSRKKGKEQTNKRQSINFKSQWIGDGVISISIFYRLYSTRRKRAASYIIFTEDQVHILPGYPKQISTDPLLASLAFYLQFPPGTSNVDAISKDNLVSIVKGSIADISNAINSNISNVQTLVADTSTTSVTSTEVPSRPTEKDSNKMPYIIAGSVAGGLVVIIIAVIIIWQCSKPKNRWDKTGDLHGICLITNNKSIGKKWSRPNNNATTFVQFAQKKCIMSWQRSEDLW